jgi:uncharacterized protein (DUF58 family)
MLTPDELKQIRRLHLQLNRRVDSPFAGQYRSAFRGSGMEFEEVRPYVPGDDVRHIDWNVTARASAPFVKQFREERELTLVIVLDQSGSLRVGAGGRDGKTDKRLQQARLAGALAWAAVRNGDRVGMLRFTSEIEEFPPPRKSRGQAWAIVRAAYDPPPARRGTNLTLALERLGRSLHRRAVICILSDWVADPWDRALQGLSQRHHTNAFLLHDPLESALPDVGLIELEDAETGAVRLVDAGAITAREPLDARVRRLRRAGAWATAVSTADDPFSALLGHFQRLERTR